MSGAEPMEERKKKLFWVINQPELTVEQHEGLGTDTGDAPIQNVWWFPDLGQSLTVGYHIFENKDVADNHLREKAKQEEIRLKERLNKLNHFIWG